MALILRNGGTYSMECLVTLTVEGGNINVEYSNINKLKEAHKINVLGAFLGFILQNSNLFSGLCSLNKLSVYRG